MRYRLRQLPPDGVTERSEARSRPLRVQTKLTVGPADDRYEREADGVALQVMARLGAAPAPAAPAGGKSAQRATLDDDDMLQAKRVSRVSLDEEDSLQAKRATSIRRAIGEQVVGASGGELDTSTAGRIDAARSGGRPLDAPVRRSMEHAFGADFSSVRMHVGGSSDRLNSELGARAFTTGGDIFMRSQDYRPTSSAGQELLAHELTHVLQQGGTASRV